MRLNCEYVCRFSILLRVLISCAGSLIFASQSTAQDADDQHPVAKVSDKVAHRPTANPDRIVLTWVGDPSTSQAVTWRTDSSVNEAFAQIALAEDGPLFASKAKQLTAVTEPFSSDLGLAHYHSINFDSLTAKTKYVYRVGDGTNWSEWIHYTTASDRPEPFTFVYFGDAQNNIKAHWSRVVREAFRDAPKAAFMLHAGDLINKANRDAEWGDWFYSTGFIHRMIPCVATPGNHEYFHVEDKTGQSGRMISRHWRPTFAFPENGPEGLAESVYWIDYQGARIVSLNSNERPEAQVPWLEAVLEDNPNVWTVITFHHPLHSSSRGRDNPELRALWQPVFDKFNVDLVLQGHDHTYARSKLMSYQNVAGGVTKRSEEAGTLYVVSVSGPKMYVIGRQPYMMRAAEDTQLYQIITVDGDELHYEARTATGRPYDRFTLRHRPGQVNQLIDQIPATPERRRPTPPATK